LVKWSGVNAFVMPREEGGGSLTLGFWCVCVSQQFEVKLLYYICGEWSLFSLERLITYQIILLLAKISSCIWRAPSYVWILLLEKRRHITVYLLIRMGGVLYLLRSLLLLRIRCKKPPPHTPCDLCMFRIMIIFALCPNTNHPPQTHNGRIPLHFSRGMKFIVRWTTFNYEQHIQIPKPWVRASYCKGLSPIGRDQRLLHLLKAI
jgi:hypothetical protein